MTTDEAMLRQVEARRNAARWLAYVAKGPRVPTIRQMYEHAKLCARLRLPPGVHVLEDDPYHDMVRQTLILEVRAGSDQVQSCLDWGETPEHCKRVAQDMLAEADRRQRARRVMRRAGVEAKPCKTNMSHDGELRV